MRKVTMLAGAFVVALVLFVAFVLPSEHGRDPLGTGRLLGLTGLYMPDGGVFGPVVESEWPNMPVHDEQLFTLEPFESVELKYDLNVGDGMVFCWRATGEVVFDLHAEPRVGTIDDARSFAAGRAAMKGGTYIAPFDGIHGWFWENRGVQPVTVQLVAGGMMTGATLYQDNDAVRVEFSPGRLVVGGCTLPISLSR